MPHNKVRAVTWELRCKAAFFGASVRREKNSGGRAAHFLTDSLFFEKYNPKGLLGKDTPPLCSNSHHSFTFPLCTWFSLQTLENKQRRNLQAGNHQVSPATGGFIYFPKDLQQFTFFNGRIKWRLAVLRRSIVVTHLKAPLLNNDMFF